MHSRLFSFCCCPRFYIAASSFTHVSLSRGKPSRERSFTLIKLFQLAILSRNFPTATIFSTPLISLQNQSSRQRWVFSALLWHTKCSPPPRGEISPKESCKALPLYGNLAFSRLWKSVAYPRALGTPLPSQTAGVASGGELPGFPPRLWPGRVLSPRSHRGLAIFV